MPAMMQLLTAHGTGLVLVDVQEKLMAAMHRKELVSGNLGRLIHLARVFDLPLVLTEQNPQGLGRTLPEIRKLLADYAPIEKLDFDCLQVAEFKQRLSDGALENIILAGVETHVCILQTCVPLLQHGYTVHVPQDAVDSRTQENWQVGLGLMGAAGAHITSTETLIFQLLQKAGTDRFKDLLKVVK